jgi:hypothetical protein
MQSSLTWRMMGQESVDVLEPVRGVGVHGGELPVGNRERPVVVVLEESIVKAQPACLEKQGRFEVHADLEGLSRFGQDRRPIGIVAVVEHVRALGEGMSGRLHTGEHVERRVEHAAAMQETEHAIAAAEIDRGAP